MKLSCSVGGKSDDCHIVYLSFVLPNISGHLFGINGVEVISCDKATCLYLTFVPLAREYLADLLVDTMLGRSYFSKWQYIASGL